jgi:hypothetical protein
LGFSFVFFPKIQLENKFMGEGKGKDAGFVVGLGHLALSLWP